LARIVILESDLVYAAGLADPLEDAGNRVQALDDPLLALAVLFERGADLFLFDLQFPNCDTGDLVNAIREQKETRATNVVGLGRGMTSKERVRFFQQGVDEIIERDAEPEEILLRIRRLVGDRSTESSTLAGGLGDRQLADFLQYVQHAGQSGILAVSSGQGMGRIELHQGNVIQARWENLTYDVALLAILGLKVGRFRLETNAGPTLDAGVHVLPIQPFLFRAAWLDDEVEKRRPWIPGTGILLRVTGQPGLPALDPDWQDVPVAEVLDRVRSSQGCRLFDLLQMREAAPQEIRLAVAVLIEQGFLMPTLDGLAASTRELDVGQLFEIALMSLIERFGHRGGPTALSLLLLAEGDGLDALSGIMSGVRHAALGELVEQIEELHGGSAVINVETGRVTIHVQQLSNAAAPRLAVLLPGCDAVVIWLADGRESDAVRLIHGRLNASSRETRGLMIAPQEGGRELAEGLCLEGGRWTLATRRPTSVTGLFRLLAARKT
jgi:DNA-binding response OmpR family regulator